MTDILVVGLVVSLIWNFINFSMILQHKIDRRRHTRGKNAFGQDIEEVLRDD